MAELEESSASRTKKQRGSRIPLVIGLAALGGGAWLLLNSRGFAIPQFKDLWPFLLILAGFGTLADYMFLSRRPGSAGWSVVLVGLGVLAFALTLDYTTWKRILDWLPSFPTIIGLGLLTTWIAGARDNANLPVAGMILLSLGIMGFGARFDWLKEILPSVQVFWAILLVVAGGYLVYRYGRGRG